jgi:hypothetical protein
MTKREHLALRSQQTEMQALRDALAVATASLTSNYLDPVEAIVPETGWVNGWMANTMYLNADKGWREGHLCGWGRHRVGSRYDRRSPDYNCSASQSGRTLYATERDALIALRREVENKAKSELAKIDQLIAKG